MLNFNSILLFSEQPTRLAEFYQKVFEGAPTWTGGNYYSFKVGDAYITIGPHIKVQGVNPNPERLLLNFESEDVEGDFNRIKELGAIVVAEPYHPDEMAESTIATFADPDGNYFQIVSPMEEMMQEG